MIELLPEHKQPGIGVYETGNPKLERVKDIGGATN
jgi:hypothetical protein